MDPTSSMHHPHWRLFLVSVLASLCLAASETGSDPESEGETESAPPSVVVQPPPLRPVNIVAPRMAERPLKGMGRLSIEFDGNRRWCTAPDDRLFKPTRGDPRRSRRRNEVFTFGYQFTIAAIRRGAADRALMLFESPVIRTASYRTAAKLGRGTKKGGVGPGIGGGGKAKTAGKVSESPGSLVPYWEELYRCTTVDERFDFDMEPGTYDVYIAFDILNRKGGWVHRNVGFLENVTIASGRRTLLEGLVNLGGIRRREVELLGATIEDTASPADADGP